MTRKRTKASPKSMVARMLQEANAAYPEKYIAQYFDMETGALKKSADGDLLAQFIGAEIVELTDENISANDNRQAIESALSNAAKELNAVIAAFRSRSEA